ncbi:MAG: bifunctional protein-serine/threonine kinase/phosphatase [Gammaproteobacteria bacterium]|nr:bifunctional protein-serine/threonine kinase/phosphatase [Gammaproteobacteria bacterium]
MSSALTISAAQYSEKGIKKYNEDACGIRVPEGSLLTTKGIAVAIADGVSSAEAGREAAEACIKGFFSDYYSTPESWTVKNSGQKVLGALNRWLYGQGQSSFSSGQGMLTTFSAIIFKSTTAHLFHVGDSRIWRLRGGELQCLTRDHQTWASSEKAFLCRAMGADISIEIDYRSLPVENDDLYLLTTDGVHDYVNDKTLLELCQLHATQPERAARAIATRALENGSHDNVTCQLLAVTSLPDQNEEEFYRHLTELPFPPPLESGQIIDGYKILRELHASKRTQVYLALDTESNEKVIMKTPSVNFEDDAHYIDGFLHEEWVGKRIHSPHVLKVLEPRRRRRFLYYITEYIEGQTLEQWINDHPQADISNVRPLIEQIIAGVRAFHRQEMIHQDLKPGNIMIDMHGIVKIVDFGSTKIAGIQEINTPIEHGELLGTYDYAAPEYFQGYPGTVHSDLYSIGVIAYEMLTGKLPYGGPLSARSLRRVSYIPARHINSEIPAWIDGALEKALHLNPSQRYAVMSEFITDLATPNPTLIKEGQPLLHRNPIAFWRGLSIMLLLINLVLLYLITRK